MRTKLYAVLISVMVLAMVLSACATSTPEAETVQEEAGGEEISRGAILSRVKERGKLVCGGRTDLLGFGYLDDSGRNIGFDTDLCRAIAAAVLGDPELVEIVPLTAADRGPGLRGAGGSRSGELSMFALIPPPMFAP